MLSTRTVVPLSPPCTALWLFFTSCKLPYSASSSDPAGTEDSAWFVDPAGTPAAELPFLELPRGRGNSWYVNTTNVSTVKNCTGTNTCTQGINLWQWLSCGFGDQPGTSDAALRNVGWCGHLSTQLVLASSLWLLCTWLPRLLGSLRCRSHGGSAGSARVPGAAAPRCKRAGAQGGKAQTCRALRSGGAPLGPETPSDEPRRRGSRPVPGPRGESHQVTGPRGRCRCRKASAAGNGPAGLPRTSSPPPSQPRSRRWRFLPGGRDRRRYKQVCAALGEGESLLPLFSRAALRCR